MLGFDIRWSEVPIIIKIGMLFWIGAVICFGIMVAAAFPFLTIPTASLLKVAYIGGALFFVGIMMMVIGLPGVKNHHKG